MNYTGERAIYDHESTGRAVALYETAYKFIKDKRVLDYGCGVGLGIEALKKHAKSVMGYDPCVEAIEEARKKHPDCEFRTEIGWELPDVDVIVSLEVIEHMEKGDLVEFLQSVAAKGIAGFFSTPNGNRYPYHPQTTAERRGFHVWHYTYEELKKLFSMFNNFDIFGVEWDNNNSFMTFGIYAQ